PVSLSGTLMPKILRGAVRNRSIIKFGCGFSSPRALGLCELTLAERERQEDTARVLVDGRRSILFACLRHDAPMLEACPRHDRRRSALEVGSNRLQPYCPATRVDRRNTADAYCALRPTRYGSVAVN